jgi:hypothetical protein
MKNDDTAMNYKRIPREYVAAVFWRNDETHDNESSTIGECKTEKRY